MRFATSVLGASEGMTEDVGQKLQLEPLLDILKSPALEELLRGVWESPICFEPSSSTLALALGREEGVPLPEVLREIREKVVRHAIHTRHPWALAHMTPPPATASVLADLIVGAINQCAFIWEEGPLAKCLEVETVAWLTRRLGLASGATGLLTSGGTLSNCLAAYLALARIREQHGEGAGRLAVVASDQAHLSVRKAAALVGVGADAVFSASTDGQGRLPPGQVAAATERALAAGRRPFLFICTAGTSNAGILEPPEEFLIAARTHGAWCHVDASHGGVVALGRRAHLATTRWAEADSISWDPHKSLYVSFAIGALLLREEALLNPLEFHSEYALKEDGRNEDAGAWHLEGSRRLEALKLWMVIRHLGDAGLEDLTEHSLDLAHHLARLVQATKDFELLTTPDTNLVCFRFYNREMDPATLDGINARLQRRLYQSGGPLLSSTRVGGKVILRAVLVNPFLEVKHLPEILEALRSEAHHQMRGLSLHHSKQPAAGVVSQVCGLKSRQTGEKS